MRFWAHDESCMSVPSIIIAFAGMNMNSSARSVSPNKMLAGDGKKDPLFWWFMIFMIVPRWSSQFFETFVSKRIFRRCLITSLLALSAMLFSSLEYASVFVLCIPHIANSSVIPLFANSVPPSCTTSSGVKN